jgi:hypothetical protein
MYTNMRRRLIASYEYMIALSNTIVTYSYANYKNIENATDWVLLKQLWSL